MTQLRKEQQKFLLTIDGQGMGANNFGKHKLPPRWEKTLWDF